MGGDDTSRLTGAYKQMHVDTSQSFHITSYSGYSTITITLLFKYNYNAKKANK